MSNQSVMTPQFAKITNQFLTNGQKGECNPSGNHNNFGNYFQQCSQDNQSAHSVLIVRVHIFLSMHFRK